MHFDMAPYIRPSEAAAAAAAVCTQVGGKRIRLYIEFLQGGRGKDILLTEILYIYIHTIYYRIYILLPYIYI